MSPEAQRLEAILFLAGEAVSLAELQRVADLTAAQLSGCLDELAAALGEHGLALVRTAEQAQLATAPAVSEFVTQYVTTANEVLSAAATETLALIAYRGPITRPELDAIRGVDSRRMVRQLLRRGLVQMTRPAGRAPQYVVTTELLHQFGVTRVAELPEYDQLANDEAITGATTP